MQKKIIETPRYDTVQVGVDEKEIWVTSDGVEFYDERRAELHEFYGYKLNQRDISYLPIDRVTIMDLKSMDDLIRYERENVFLDQLKQYDENKLKFPNTFVLYCETVCTYQDPDEDYEHNDYETYLYCVTLNEYKEMMIKGINELK